MRQREMVEQFRRCAESCGFELLVGEFVRRDGTRSRFHLRPTDGRVLIRLAMRCPPFEQPKVAP